MPITEESRTEKAGGRRPKSPPQPIDEDEKSHRRSPWPLFAAFAVTMVALVTYGVLHNSTPQANIAEDIASVYDHAIILQAREGDSLESAALAVFPNTLIEARVREDGLSDDAKRLERERYQAEWVRLARLLTGTTGTSLAAGEYFAVPAKHDEPGAIQADGVSTEIQRRNEEAQKASSGD